MNSILPASFALHAESAVQCMPWVETRRSVAVVPVFLPFRGCVARCIYCAQDVQTGRARVDMHCSQSGQFAPSTQSTPPMPPTSPGQLDQSMQSGQPTLSAQAGQFTQGDQLRQPAQAAQSLDALLAPARAALRLRVARGLEPAELAFYGGTFTAMSAHDQRRCLDFAKEMLDAGSIVAFRCSTRPDCVNDAALNRLKQAGCVTVELGVQSFADHALQASRRGYDGACAHAACARVKAAGLNLGVQLMPGMPGVDAAVFLADTAQALAVNADMLRFYPCLVIAGTELARLYKAGRYQPWSLEDTLEALARAWLMAAEAHVPVIRMGLAPEPALDAAVLAGPVDAALGSRIMGRALLLAVRGLAAGMPIAQSGQTVQSGQTLSLEVPQACRGYMWGMRGDLRVAWEQLGINPKRVNYGANGELRLMVN